MICVLSSCQPNESSACLALASVNGGATSPSNGYGFVSFNGQKSQLGCPAHIRFLPSDDSTSTDLKVSVSAACAHQLVTSDGFTSQSPAPISFRYQPSLYIKLVSDGYGRVDLRSNPDLIRLALSLKTAYKSKDPDEILTQEAQWQNGPKADRASHTEADPNDDNTPSSGKEKRGYPCTLKDQAATQYVMTKSAELTSQIPPGVHKLDVMEECFQFGSVVHFRVSIQDKDQTQIKSINHQVAAPSSQGDLDRQYSRLLDDHSEKILSTSQNRVKILLQAVTQISHRLFSITSQSSFFQAYTLGFQSISSELEIQTGFLSDRSTSFDQSGFHRLYYESQLTRGSLAQLSTEMAQYSLGDLLIVEDLVLASLVKQIQRSYSLSSAESLRVIEEVPRKRVMKQAHKNIHRFLPTFLSSLDVTEFLIPAEQQALSPPLTGVTPQPPQVPPEENEENEEDNRIVENNNITPETETGPTTTTTTTDQHYRGGMDYSRDRNRQSGDQAQMSPFDCQ